jgi:hypothetical protein
MLVKKTLARQEWMYNEWVPNPSRTLYLIPLKCNSPREFCLSKLSNLIATMSVGRNVGKQNCAFMRFF